MSLTQPDTTEDSPLPSTDLTLNLNSNNPFRNRATSPPQLSPGQLSPGIPRPVSRNPFLDASEPTLATATLPTMSASNGALAPKTFVPGEAAELFDSLTLNDKPQGSSNVTRPEAPRSNTTDKHPTAPTKSENIPPRGPPRHRPTRSQEDAMRARRAAAGGERRGSKGELNVFADPNNSPRRSGERRPRRNSESSVLENGQKKPVDPEEEKKQQQERRRRDREKRHRERDAKNKKPDRKLDVIDQLDATSIYGAGLFHHDGPFDACNPHRNRRGSRRAPMQAFPKDSLNNVLGGGGPLNKRPDHATFLGNNNAEAFKDYARSGEGGVNYESYNGSKAVHPTVLSSLQRVEPIHGEESLGLGTSTFLEGAPASRNAIQRRNTETEPDLGGLNRKKSLAQKIRGISNNRRDYPGSSGRSTNPDGAQNVTSPRSPDYAPGGTKHNSTENNPFFTEYKKNSFDEEKRDGKDGKQGETITIVEHENKAETAKAPGSPVLSGPLLERRVTSDGNGEEPKTGGMGFLSRVKSLKTGGRRAPPPRPEKPAN